MYNYKAWYILYSPKTYNSIEQTIRDYIQLLTHLFSYPGVSDNQHPWSCCPYYKSYQSIVDQHNISEPLLLLLNLIDNNRCIEPLITLVKVIAQSYFT